MNCINRISFKLKSAKYLFCIGVIITLVITSFATSKDSDDFQQKIQVTSELITENFTKFLVITFVLIVNLYYCAKLIEGIVHRLPYKILPWIIINTVNIVELTVYFFTIDSLIGYITLIVYSYVWMGMIVLFFETKKSVREEIMECTMAESNTPYDTFPKPEV